jgi:hypothetical protein
MKTRALLQNITRATCLLHPHPRLNPRLPLQSGYLLRSEARVLSYTAQTREKGGDPNRPSRRRRGSFRFRWPSSASFSLDKSSVLLGW